MAGKISDYQPDGGVTTSYSNWDFNKFHIQQDVKAGQFVNAASTLVAAGLPFLGSQSGDSVYPIGLLESMGLQQTKQLQRIFEIGSMRSYFIPGRVIGSLSLGRTFYFGPSLLKALYAYYRQTNPQNIHDKNKGAVMNVSVGDGATASVPDPRGALIDILNSDGNGLKPVQVTPGEDLFWMNLASDLFSQPTGMAIYFRSSENIGVGAMYLEYCYVQGHQIQVSSGSVLVLEGVSIQYDNLVPVKLLTGA